MTKAIGEEAIKGIEQGTLPAEDIAPTKDERLFSRLASAVERGEISPEQIPDIVKTEGLTPEIARQWKETISNAGRHLNVLSQIAKKLSEADPALANIFEDSATGWQKVMGWYRRIDNVRRSMLVSQLTTAVRNAESQGLRHGLQIFDDVIAGTMETLAGKKNLKEAFIPALEDFYAIGRQLDPVARARLASILDKYPLEKAKLLGTVAGDIPTDQRVMRVLNVANTAQEYFFRKMRFDAALTSECLRQGIDPLKEKIPQSILDTATKSALENTFSLSPQKYGAAKSLMKIYSEAPVLTALANPFPRFWVNSLKFLWDFNPTGFSRLLDKNFRAELNSKNPREAYSSLAKATLGTSMLAAGVAIRNSKYRGEEWYEIKIGDRYIDCRAFAPFSTYLFIGEALTNGKNLTGTDWLQGAIGINRIAGSGLVIVDMVRSGTPEGTVKKLKEFVGQYLGGFTVPFKTLKDLLSEVDHVSSTDTAKKIASEEAIVRSTKESPLTGPLRSNVPGLDVTLPQAYRPTRKEPFKTEEGGLRQLLGITAKTKTPLEKEIDRLNVSDVFYPKTGNPTFDGLITKEMGKRVEALQSYILSSPYNALGDYDKEATMRQRVLKIKTDAKRDAQLFNGREIVDSYFSEARGKTGDERREYLDKLGKRGVLDKRLMRQLRVRLIVQKGSLNGRTKQ